jgi:hypothetical protein
MNGVTCVFLQFYSDVVLGEDSSIIPRWIGIDGISNTLASTETALDTISANYQQAFSGNDWTSTLPPQFESDLASTYKNYYHSSLVNPNPLSNTKSNITPIYITEYGNYTDQGQELNYIFQEFNLKINLAIDSLNHAKSYSQSIDQNMDDIKSTIDGVQSNILSILNAFNNIDTEVITRMIEVVRLFKSYNNYSKMTSITMEYYHSMYYSLFYSDYH